MKQDERELSDLLRNPFLPRGALIRRAPYSSLRLHKDKSGAGASAEKVKEGKRDRGLANTRPDPGQSPLERV